MPNARALLVVLSFSAPAPSQCPPSVWTPAGPTDANELYAVEVFDDGSGPAVFWAGECGVVGSNSFERGRDLEIHDDGTGPSLYVGYDGGVSVWTGAGWTGSGVGGVVTDLESSNGHTGSQTLYAARGEVYELTGGVWSQIPGVSGADALALHDDGTGVKLYAAGRSMSSLNHVAAWDGSSWTSLGSGLGGATSSAFPLTMESYDDGTGAKLFVGGFFDTAGGVPANDIACWDGQAWSAIPGSTVGDVQRLRSLKVGLGPPELFVAWGGGVTSWDGQEWSPVVLPVNSYVGGLAFTTELGPPALYVGLHNQWMGEELLRGSSPTQCIGDGGYWRFEEGLPAAPATGTGTIVNELWANEPGTPSGGPTYSSDASCAVSSVSIELDGVDDHITFPNTFVFHAPYQEATVEMWLKLPDPQQHRNLLWTTTSGVDTNRFHLYTNSGGIVGLDYYGPTGGTLHTVLDPDGSIVIPPNVWIHLAIVRSVEQSGAHTYRAYVNETLVKTQVDAVPDLPDSQGWTIAGRPAPHLGAAGFVDEVRLTSYAMEPSEFLSTPCIENYCTAGISASGCMAVASASGHASATASSGFLLSATNVEGAKDGMFFYGANGRQAQTWGSGFQCVIPPVRRGGLLNAPIGSTVGSCDGAFAQDLNARWCPTCPAPNHNPGAGSVVQAQFWYRDPQNTGNKTTTLSDAIEFTVGP